MFALLVLLAAALPVLETPAWRTAGLIAAAGLGVGAHLLFVSYVLERYVDPRLRYAGPLALLRPRRNLPRCSDRSPSSR